MIYHESPKRVGETVGGYRYRHKGSGLTRETLMPIGRACKGTAKNMAKTAAEKAAKTVAEKAWQKVGEIVVEKGLKISGKYCGSASRNQRRCRRTSK